MKDNLDETYTIYQKILAEVQKHTTPSPETIKSFDTIKEELYKNNVFHVQLEGDVKHIKDTVGGIDKKVTETNGRVKKLEKAKSMVIGGAVVLGFFAGIGGIPALINWMADPEPAVAEELEIEMTPELVSALAEEVKKILE